MSNHNLTLGNPFLNKFRVKWTNNGVVMLFLCIFYFELMINFPF